MRKVFIVVYSRININILTFVLKYSTNTLTLKRVLFILKQTENNIAMIKSTGVCMMDFKHSNNERVTTCCTRHAYVWYTNYVYHEDVELYPYIGKPLFWKKDIFNGHMDYLDVEFVEFFKNSTVKKGVEDS